MRVGRGSDEIDQLYGLAGAVTLKPPVNAEKSKALRTDRQTDRAGCRVACTRLNSKSPQNPIQAISSLIRSRICLLTFFLLISIGRRNRPRSPELWTLSFSQPPTGNSISYHLMEEWKSQSMPTRCRTEPIIKKDRQTDR